MPVAVSYLASSGGVEDAELVTDTPSPKSKLGAVCPYGVVLPLPGREAYSGGGVSVRRDSVTDTLLLCSDRVRRMSLMDWQMEGRVGMRLWTTAGRT